MEAIESHKRVLGILYIISAVLLALCMILLGALIAWVIQIIVGAMGPEDSEFAKLIASLLGFIPAFVIIFSVVPSLVAGIGLLSKQDWALTLAMIVGCFKLLSFPIGTAMGVYAIWLYFEEKKVVRANAAKL